MLPFDNRTGQPSLEWIREAAAEVLSSRFASAGFEPMSRADRMYALDHLGLPQGFHPSRASSLKLAQTLDADSIVVGSYRPTAAAIVAEAQVVDVPHLRMSQPVTARGEMQRYDRGLRFAGMEADQAAGPRLQRGGRDVCRRQETACALNAFEQYIRGITEPDQAERVQHLEAGGAAEPGF